MSLVYSGVLSHAPGITGRANLVDNVDKRDEFYAALQNQRSEIITSGAEAIIVIAAAVSYTHLTLPTILLV